MNDMISPGYNLFRMKAMAKDGKMYWVDPM